MTQLQRDISLYVLYLLTNLVNYSLSSPFTPFHQGEWRQISPKSELIEILN